ncbi:TetR/AcrR family transcriptional regulator [Saccharopolyspora shandongensis]|uniref:TetR/AcrR family transcriptional regulator n=1 Tax=Saccharopolyspora shandongensis TaxID=418495 RepID=UPI0033E5DA2C
MPNTNGGDGGTEPAAQRGRPTGDHAAKRAELLKAATSVIAQDGYANASLRKVAQRAGCTTGAVTYYFANKAELVTALAESRFDGYDAMLEAVRAQADIKALFERWLSVTTGDPEFWPVMSQLLAHARYEPALAAVIEHRYARYRDVYTTILEAGQAQGTIRDDIPADLLADQLAAMGDGWMMMFPFEPERFTPSRLQALVDAALALIAPAPSAPGSQSTNRGGGHPHDQS